MDAPIVTISGHPVTLGKPRPLAALALGRSREELEAAPPALMLALGAAALWVSWPPDRAWPVRVPPQPWKASQPIEEMGHAIFDSLGEMIPAVPLMHACMDAYRWATSHVLTEPEVAAAEGFSPPPGQGG